MSTKKISICMATFNGEPFVHEQLASILPQLGENDEIIVSDDGSSDRTVDVLASFNDQRIKIYQNQFRDVVSNFEYTLTKATGDIIFLSDQDDIWYKDKVERYLEALQDCDLVFSNLNIFSGDKNTAKPLFNPKRNHNQFLGNFVKNHCVGATLAFKSHLLKYILPFPRRIAMHDMWIYFISSFYGKTYYFKTCTIYYRRHASNVSNTGSRTDNSIFRIIEIRLIWIRALLQRFTKVALGGNRKQ